MLKKTSKTTTVNFSSMEAIVFIENMFHTNGMQRFVILEVTISCAFQRKEYQPQNLEGFHQKNV